MKGQFELSETFIKFIQIAILILGTLAVFFTFIEYEIIVAQNSVEREVQVLGNALLSSSCLNDGVKGVFTQTKLDIMAISSACLKYSKGRMEVNVVSPPPELSSGWVIEFGPYDIGEERSYDVIVRLNSGDVKAGSMKVIL